MSCTAAAQRAAQSISERCLCSGYECCPELEGEKAADIIDEEMKPLTDLVSKLKKCLKEAADEVEFCHSGRDTKWDEAIAEAERMGL